MKTLVSLVAALSLAACMDSQPGGGTPPRDPPTALSSDAHFVVVVPPYTSPEDCLANEKQQIFICTSSISFCKNGRAGQRLGDLDDEGTYTMVGSVAHASFVDGQSLAFDVDAVVDLDAPGEHWIVDTQERWNTLQFDNIDCDQP